MTTIAEANSIYQVVRSLHRNATDAERQAGLGAIEFLADRAHDRLQAGPGGQACARTLQRAHTDIDAATSGTPRLPS
jgi:hypothetical protein